MVDYFGETGECLACVVEEWLGNEGMGGLEECLQIWKGRQKSELLLFSLFCSK